MDYCKGLLIVFQQIINAEKLYGRKAISGTV